MTVVANDMSYQTTSNVRPTYVLNYRIYKTCRSSMKRATEVPEALVDRTAFKDINFAALIAARTHNIVCLSTCVCSQCFEKARVVPNIAKGFKASHQIITIHPQRRYSKGQTVRGTNAASSKAKSTLKATY